MLTVRFSAPRLVEFTNPMLFQVQVGKWLELREAENSYLLGRLPWVVAGVAAGNALRDRLFALLDGDHIVGACILFNGGHLFHTWASPEMMDAMADGLLKANCQLRTLFGPAHVSWQLAKRIADRTGAHFAADRAERIYQLSRLEKKYAAAGGLEIATEADIPFLRPWISGFVNEAKYEMAAAAEETILNDLIRGRALYIWKQPEPRAMVAWTAPTSHGGSINFVYTPPGLRRRGHARSAVLALAEQKLAQGAWYCFILTDIDDAITNRFYQQIGARTLCELLRCTIAPQVAAAGAPQWMLSA